MVETHVVVGASLAGANAAAALRKLGFDGRVVLIGDERERPYERPELSKRYLRGEPGGHIWVHEPDFYAEQRIEWLAERTVESIDVARREVVAGGEPFAFDRLLLATGATAHRLPVSGGDLEGITTLRTMAEADRLRELASAAHAIVVVGGGWIGSEVAASLRQLGHDVTFVLSEATPLERVLGPEVGEVYRSAHEEHGVRLIPHARVTGFDGNPPGRVAAAVLGDGRRLPADLVVLGVGAGPRTALAADAGLAVDNGILVDEFLQTSVPGIYAAGDVANAWHPVFHERIRVEHWDNAKRQGRAAAANMLGIATPYTRVPYFYSDQYDLGMEYWGHAPTWDEVVFRGDPASREFIAFWLGGSRVVAAMHMNVWDAAHSLAALVASRDIVDRRDLTDTGRPLGEIRAAA
jgi:3-phenylpropionate/trans-cinnamate dioxygenase ferredoxin reductase subunit